MPVINEDTFKAFCNLCERYGLPDSPGKDGFNWSLLNLYAERRDGHFLTELESLEDPFPLAEVAELLYKIKNSSFLTIDTDHEGAAFTTRNPDVIKLLEKMLATKLREKVFRYGDFLVVRKGDGPDGAYIVNKGTVSSENGFTLDELKALIDQEYILCEKLEKESFPKRIRELKGRKAPGSTCDTRVKDLSPVVYEIIEQVNAYEINEASKYCFVFDFMDDCRYFGFRGQDWSEEHTGSKEKFDYIKGLLKAF